MEEPIRPPRPTFGSEMLLGVTTLGVATLPSGEASGGSRDDIIGACQRGDSEAFAQLFEAHKDRVYSIALRFFGDSATAMDIAQDVFVKLLSRIGDFRGESRFETWLYRMAANACLDHRRRLVRWAPFVSDVVDLMKSKGEGALDGLLREEFQGGVQRSDREAAGPKQLDCGGSALYGRAVLRRYCGDFAHFERDGCFASEPAHKTLERRLQHMKKG